MVGVGGEVGKAGQLLQTGQFAQVGATEKLLETTGLLKKTDISGTGIYAGIKEQKSNIGLLRRIGEERGGGLLTGQYTPSTSVFSNFVRELPVTTLGMAGDIFLDPLFFASKTKIVSKGLGVVGTGIKQG